MRKLIALAALWATLSGCTQVQLGTKSDAFPLMYGDRKPVSMLIVPAINQSTAADAGDFLNVTVAQPFANHGYYVLSAPIVADIFRREGVLEGTQIKGLPATLFKKTFGADSVLFLTITEWDKNYAVLAANVTVGIEYVLLSTETSQVLWSYKERVVLDTSGSSGNLLADLVTTALATAMTDYVPVAFQVHQRAVGSLPFGRYHPRSGLDGADKSVNMVARDAAVGATE